MHKVKKVWDPWAEPEPIFGPREISHALSPHPGTPPFGNVAVPAPAQQGAGGTTRSAASIGQARSRDSVPGVRASPEARTPGAPREPARSGAGGFSAANLAPLAEAVRVEIGLEHCGRWTCGLCARAGKEVLEVALGTRSVGTRDFLVTGRRVRLLVTPRSSQPFAIQARVICVEPPADPAGAVLVELALDSQDPVARSSWEALLAPRDRSGRGPT